MTLVDRKDAEAEATRTQAVIHRLLREQGSPDRYTFPAPGQLLVEQLRALRLLEVPR